MKQAADVRPEPNLQRKAAIAYGGVRDHAGKVTIAPMPGFDLNKTIFQTLESPAARYLMAKRVGKEVYWRDDVALQVQSDYAAAVQDVELPEIDPALMKFMVEECDFDVEHADGSFLDHLYFCYEYTVKYYPQGSPVVELLHSILGTGTNTFAMSADKIPQLEALLSPSDWRQVEAFPSLLRLLYAGDIRRELRENPGREVGAITMRRVIDNAPIEMSGEMFWEAMNYQVIHLVDFMPVANWSAYDNDTSFILFRDVYELMTQRGKLEAHIDYTPATGPKTLEGDHMGLGAWLLTKLPVSTAERLAEKSIRRFSEQCGHSLDYEITWKA